MKKNHQKTLRNVRSYKNIPPYQISCLYDEYWLNNNQKTNLRQYANELFGKNY